MATKPEQTEAQNIVVTRLWAASRDKTWLTLKPEEAEALWTVFKERAIYTRDLEEDALTVASALLAEAHPLSHANDAQGEKGWDVPEGETLDSWTQPLVENDGYGHER